MEILSLQFLTALAAVVVIDLVLAGDNAIVIALAARNVPKHLQRRAVVWGTVGAIVVRSTLTGVVVWLLQIPGLLFAGGAALVWIGYKLLAPENGGHGENGQSPSTFFAAMRTIVVADTIMGMDNILAVAGAAHGSYLLVVLGLLISVPIMIWGSTLLLKWVERFPSIVYIGSAVIVWTAAKMMLSEPLIAHVIEEHPIVTPLTYLVLVPGVLWAGLVANHRVLEARIHERLARFGERGFASVSTPKEEPQMIRVLVPVDASGNTRHALEQVRRQFAANSDMEVHLLNVQAPFSRHIARFSSKRSRDAWHREQAEKAFAPARKALDTHGIPYTTHVAIGDRAACIVEAARKHRCGHIVMATARKNSLTRMIQDSVTHRVLELTDVPVQVVAGDQASAWERWGIPAAVSSIIAALVVAAAVD